MPIRFSTEEVPENDRLAVWREVLGRVHLHLDVEPACEGPLRATVESHRWSSTSLYFSHTTPVRAARTSELVQDGDGDFRLLFVEGAGYRFTANGIDEVVAGGNGALLFNGAVAAVTYLGPCQVTAVRVPRTALIAQAAAFDDRPIRRGLPDSPAFGLLAEYTKLLRRNGPSSDPILTNRVAAHLADLVALSIGATRDAAEVACGRGVRAARLATMKADVDANLGNPALSADMLGQRHGVTPRYVRKLFEADGLSVSEFILERRLARAYRILDDLRNFNRPISVIAFACGFGDLSYFNRTFRRRFGATPSDVRAQALRERT